MVYSAFAWHAYRHSHTTDTSSRVWYLKFTRLNVSLTELALGDAERGLCTPNAHIPPFTLPPSLPTIYAVGLPLSSFPPTNQQSSPDSEGHFWGLIPFVGGGGREGWMIYWLLYKSRARVVISFQDAVMRFWSVFSPRWCDFVPDIINAPAVCVSSCLWACACCVVHACASVCSVICLSVFYLEISWNCISIFVRRVVLKSENYFQSANVLN